MASCTVQLDRHLQNHDFESWKIGSQFVSQRLSLCLPGSVYLGAADAVDLAHTKAAALCNHLIASAGRLFVITEVNLGSLCVNEITPQHDGQVAVSKVADINVPGVVSPLQPSDAALHCSLALLSCPAAAAAPQRTPPSAGAAAPSLEGSLGAFRAVMSTGKGDLVLISTSPGQPAQVSAPVFPLHQQPPAVGLKPFSISAAWTSHPSGLIRVTCSCLTDAPTHSSASRQRGHHSRQSAWVCETWLVTLSANSTPAAAGTANSSTAEQQQQQQQQQPAVQLHVLACQLLHVSRSPPAAAAVDAAAERLLLVAEPGLEEGDLPEGYQQRLAPTLGHLQASAAAAATAAVSGGGSQNCEGAAMNGDGGAMNGGDAAMDGDDDDEMDPRTLAAAAARLAKYTSEAEVGDWPQQQWSDVFREAGPGEMAAGGSEAAADILLFAPTSSGATGGAAGAAAPETLAATAAAAAAAAAETAAAAAAAAGGPFRLQCTASCGPHKLLAAEEVGGKSHIAGAGERSGVLLGLTDDVDCAVVSATLSTHASTPAAAAAAGAGAGASPPEVGSSGGGIGSSGQLVLRHTSFLPALAYVVAGKTQKRHLLLAHDPTSPVCAVLVEGFKYCYLYGQVATGATHGQQQIVDMELPAGQSVLGARLVQLYGRDTSNSSSSSHEGQAGDATLLLLLTQSQLVCCKLQAPSSA